MKSGVVHLAEHPCERLRVEKVFHSASNARLLHLQPCGEAAKTDGFHRFSIGFHRFSMFFPSISMVSHRFVLDFDGNMTPRGDRRVIVKFGDVRQEVAIMAALKRMRFAGV